MRPRWEGAALVFVCSLSVGQDLPIDDSAGRDLAAGCAVCHGTAGRSAGGMPALAGLDKAYIERRMSEFKTGARPATVMHHIARGYDERQIALIAEYFSRQRY